MNIHLPAILGFTRYQGFDPSPCIAHVTLPMSTGTTIDSLGSSFMVSGERRTTCRRPFHGAAFADARPLSMAVWRNLAGPLCQLHQLGYRNWVVLKPIGYIRYEILWVRRIQFLGRFPSFDKLQWYRAWRFHDCNTHVQILNDIDIYIHIPCEWGHVRTVVLYPCSKNRQDVDSALPHASMIPPHFYIGNSKFRT